MDDSEDDVEEHETQLKLLVRNVHEEIAAQQAGLAMDKDASMIWRSS